MSALLTDQAETAWLSCQSPVAEGYLKSIKRLSPLNVGLGTLTLNLAAERSLSDVSQAAAQQVVRAVWRRQTD